MLLKIFKNRTVSSSGTWGTKNENNYEILNFEFPEELEEYNKRIVYYLGNQKVWDAIIDNKAILTNAITTKGSVKAYIWCTKSDEAFETDVDFRTQIFVMNFFENDNADGIVPTPEQVDGFNTMLTAMNAKIDEVDALETTIETAEAERQEAEATRVSNENTRESNESTRQTNEQTRQTQEADRERRTDEAIADIQDKTAEYNANAEEKTNEFNDLVETQKLVIENYADTQLNAIGKKGKQALSSITTTTQYALQNISLAQQTGVSAVETASSEATTNFNTNATNKTNAFNSNATEKTTAFNDNASTKTSDFNDNTTQKTTNFDNNATEKTNEFNTNAQEKIDEYDEHIVEYQAQIDELQEEVEELSENMPWAETEQATEIQVTDAAKYSKNKLELFGNTSQESTTGKNLLVNNVTDYSYNGITYTINFDKSVTINGTATGQSNLYFVGASSSYVDLGLSAGKYTLSGCSNSSSSKYILYCVVKHTDETTTSYSQTNSAQIIDILEGDTFRIFIRTVSGAVVNNEIVYPQLEAGETATDYEPYTGGQPSPNPDYPQPIHVVTGNNRIFVGGKNFFGDFHMEAKRLNIDQKITNSTVTLKNTANSTGFLFNLNKPKMQLYKGTYCLSINNFSGTISGGDISIVIKNGDSTLIDSLFTTQGIYYFTLDQDCEIDIDLYLRASSIKFSNVQFDVQVEFNEKTSYEDFLGYKMYPLNLEDKKIARIGTSIDRVFKNEKNNPLYKGTLDYGCYYIKKSINLFNLRSYTPELITSGWGITQYEDMAVFMYSGTYNIMPGNDVFLCNRFKRYGFDSYFKQHNVVGITDGAGYLRIYVRVPKTIASTPAELNAYFDENPCWVLHKNKNVQYIKLTDETLISQLDAIYEHLKLVKGTNHITITPSDLEPYVTLNYMQDLPSKLDNLDSRLSLLE